MLFGYIFWLIMSKITTPQVIGVSSTVVSLGAIFATVANIGIPIGVQRFLGKSFSERKLSDAKVYVKTSLLLTAIGIVACGALILITYNWIHDTFRIDFSLIIVTISLIGSTAITTLLRSIVIASLKTKTLPIIMILSAIAKIVLGVILILIGVGALGIAISFTFYPILSSILLTISIVMIFKSLPNDKAEVSFGESFKNILVSGGASWIPYVIHTAALYLGPLLVFGSIGASQAGVYFIAYSLFTAIAAFMSVLFTIAYPVLSAMQEGRKKFAWRVTKMSLIMSLPLSYSVIFYSKQIMQLFGQDYAVGASSLQILLLSMLPIVVMTGINTLVNAYGNYRQVLAIGVATNIPTAILYLIFIPIYDNSVGGSYKLHFRIRHWIRCINRYRQKN